MSYKDDKGADMDKAMPDALKDKMDEMKDKKMDKSEDKDPADDETKVDKMDKSLSDTISVFEELLKSAPQTRTDTLLKKAQTGEIDDAEKAELVKSLQGESTETKLSDEMVKAMHPEGDAGEELKKAIDIDVDGFLASIHGGVTSALETLGESLQKSMGERSEREFILAKGMRDLLVTVQAQRQELDELAKSLGAFARTPAQPSFRSQRVPANAALQKSFGGTAASGDELSPAQINAGFSALLKSGVDSVGGEDTLNAAAKFESTGYVSPAALNEIAALKQRM